MAVNTLRERNLLRNPIFGGIVILLVTLLLSDSILTDYLVASVTSMGISVGLISIQGSAEEMGAQARSDPSESETLQDEQMRMITAITEVCLPKLVCELYAKSTSYGVTDGEKSLMSLIGVTSLASGSPSRYHYAAHMGQLIRGLEGDQGCHQFYPTCPFSGEDVRAIAKKINLK